MLVMMSTRIQPQTCLVRDRPEEIGPRKGRSNYQEFKLLLALATSRSSSPGFTRSPLRPWFQLYPNECKGEVVSLSADSGKRRGSLSLKATP